MHAALLGERLTLLRLTLALDNPNSRSNWSRAVVARAASVPASAVARLEQHGTGTAASLTALLTFYRSQGVNSAWVLAPDNERVPFYSFRDAFQSGNVAEACAHLQSLRRELLAPPPLAGAGEQAAAILSLVREHVPQALALLLPAVHALRNPTDLRTYQRSLPPVAAATAGWRSRAGNLLPLHYYDAGESLPRCGTPYDYLTCETSPVAYSSHICRASCARQVIKPVDRPPS